MSTPTDVEKKEGEDRPFSAQELLLDMPLYKSVEPDRDLLRALREDGVQFDCFCLGCGKDAPFKTTQFLRPKASPSLSSRIQTGSAIPPYTIRGPFDVVAICQRDARHKYQFYFQLDMTALVKVGQWPSLEDLAGGDLAPLRPVLSRARFAELRRATGLASHGIGIGAFVYLRRIFEGLIHEHYEMMVEAGKPVEGWEDLRMDAKVGALAEVLPRTLVENKSTYAILSAGLHELDEETCRDFFPVVRQAIIVILREDLRKRQEREEAQSLKKEIGAIAGKVRKRRTAAVRPAAPKKSDPAE